MVTSVFDGSASSVSGWLPLGTVFGTTRSTVAVPLATGTVPMSTPPTATCSVVFCGAPRLVRLSFDAVNWSGSPGTTAVGSGATSALCFAKSGARFGWASRYAIQPSRSTRPESLTSVPWVKTVKASPPWMRKLKLPMRYLAAGSIGSPSTTIEVILEPSGSVESNV